MQLASPALPIGAFAYSQALEQAVQAGWVHDESSAGDWILGLVERALGTLDVPLFGRLHAAWSAPDEAAARSWSDVLHASRGSAELQAEDRRLGSALARLLASLGIAEAVPWVSAPRATQLALFALAVARWNVPPLPAACAFLFSWAENQGQAAARLVPLGQTATQRIVTRAGALIPEIAARGLALGDDEIGTSAHGQAIASALHETAYSRIFRS